MVHARRGVDHDPLALEVNPVATGRQTLHLIQVGFIAGIDLFFPPLSTVQLPHYDIGRLSALHIINGDSHRETVRVASPWLPRESL